MSKQVWETLKVGDQVRLTEVPPEFFTPGYYIHPDTLRVYRRLVARRRPLRVFRIDEYNLPWVRFRFQRKNGRWEHHWLAINHSAIVKVKHRLTTEH